MQTISRQRYTLSLSPAHPPVARVSPGETFRVECPSALGGILDAFGKPSESLNSANPMAGPISVKNVKAGDTVAVCIKSISPVGFGKAQNVIYTPKKDKLTFLDGITVPQEPSVGCIGVAPRLESDATTNDTCGSHGGNLDCRDAAPGAFMFFRAGCAGANLGFGDVHWAMGDGEIGGQGIEGAADLIVKIHKARAAGVEWPWIVRDGWIMTLGGHPDLKTAQRVAYEEMMTLSRNVFNLERSETQARIAASGHLKVCQACCPVITVRVCLPLELLGLTQEKFLRGMILK